MKSNSLFSLDHSIILILSVLFCFCFNLHAQVIPLDGRGGGILTFNSDRDGNSEVYAMNADGSGQKNITNNPANDGFGVWSPDGMKVAFVSDRDGDFGIYVMNVLNLPNGEFDTPVKIASKRPSSRVSWYPDGSKIIFDAWPECDLYIVDADGNNLTKLTNTPDCECQPHFSPDGSKIALSIIVNNQQDVYIMNFNGGDKTKITDDGVSFFPTWSPNGNDIAIMSTRPGRQDIDICLINPDGSNRRWLTDYSNLDEFPTWSPDSLRIAYHSHRGVNQIYIMNFDGSDNHAITNNTSYNNGEPCWRPVLPTSVGEDKLNNSYPCEFLLYQNYPNPFNPVTKIKYRVPELSFVTLKVYDVLGNEVGDLVNEEKPAGFYEVEFNASSLSSGIYLYKLATGFYTDVRKMILLK